MLREFKKKTNPESDQSMQKIYLIKGQGSEDVLDGVTELFTLLGLDTFSPQNYLIICRGHI